MSPSNKATMKKALKIPDLDNAILLKVFKRLLQEAVEETVLQTTHSSRGVPHHTIELI